MSWLARWPRSLPGRMALLVTVALFVAQAINFALLLQGRQSLRFEQVIGPSMVRVLDAIERESAGRPVGRGRVREYAADPISPRLPRRPEIAAGLRRVLGENGVAVEAIDTGVGPVDPNAPWLRRLGRFRAERLLREHDQITLAVKRPGKPWLVLDAPWAKLDAALIWRLIGQTAILYVIVLLPVLWVGRRIARPLQALAEAARRYTPGGEPVPLVEAGPPDVRAVIAAFNTLQLRVTAMLDEKDRMLGAIGHDLRTPLAALRVRVESVEDEADRARMVDTIGEMNRTLDDILSLARLGRPSEPPTEVDVAALIDAVVEDFRDLGDDVSFDETARLTVRLRPSLMRRALRNLIENAVKYGQRATVELHATTRELRIAVLDAGPGIPPERMGEVFDPFTRLEGSRNRDTGGIGLGLALARAIVREARGDIVLANRAEGGLSATIVLPR